MGAARESVRADNQLTTEERAVKMVKDAERSKARMFELSGRPNDLYQGKSVSVYEIDEDYQMIDSHIDNALRKKILNFEYVDFSRLLPKARGSGSEDDRQKLEIVSKNSMTFL